MHDIHAKIKTKFVDMRELGEMLEDIDLDLITIKDLQELEDGLKSNNNISWKTISICQVKMACFHEYCDSFNEIFNIDVVLY